MKPDGWWRQPLFDWADTAGFEIELCSYPKPQVKRDLGEWWLDAGRWSLHLDSRTFGRFLPNPDVTVRRTLTWLLEKLRRTEEPSPEALLSGWFERLLEKPAEELEQLIMGSKSVLLPDGNWVDHYEAGWFALLSPQYPKTVSLSERSELRHNIVEVLESYLEDGITGWLSTASLGEHVFLYVAADTLQNEENWMESGARRSEEGQPRIRGFAEEVLDAVTQDVLVSCDLVIGSYFTGVQEMAEALLTLALLRTRHSTARSEGLAIWGERPVDILLHTVPKRGVRWFLGAVRSHSETVGGSTAVQELPEELLISLRGIVETNLNVSEAARALFIHRNTLIHRLDRLKELTGYDARVFQDALTLWLAYLTTQFGQTDSN